MLKTFLISKRHKRTVFHIPAQTKSDNIFNFRDGCAKVYNNLLPYLKMKNNETLKGGSFYEGKQPNEKSRKSLKAIWVDSWLVDTQTLSKIPQNIIKKMGI